MSSEHSSGIHWRDWSNEVLEAAEAEDKLILLDIGAPWCHWCHVMDNTTYSDPKVIRTINERFIPVRVEAEKRPDIQDRYLLGGWPSTVWLLPDGRILTGTTFITPEAMIHKLYEVDTLYHEQRATVEMQATSMEAEAEADRVDAEVVPTPQVSPESILDDLDKVLRRDFDSRYGGFGKEPKFPLPECVHYAFLRYRENGDADMREMALRTLDASLELSDPVWGGFYRYSVTPDWKKPHYEKLLNVQAGIMENYLEAYQLTGEAKYGEAVADIERYVKRFMVAGENGGFFASQDADVGSYDPASQFITGEDYYSMDEEGRLKVGTPYIDKTVYTDWNGAMVSAYLRLFQVTGDLHARDYALATVDRLLHENRADGRMCHYFDGEKRLPGLLSDQVLFAQALIDAYQTSGERRYLDEAETLVAFMVSELQDVVDGGFYFRPFDPHAKGELLERHKPFDENVAAARLLVEMSGLTGNPEYRNLADRTLQAISYPQVREGIVGMGFGIALDSFINPPMHIVIVGDPKADDTQKMLQMSLHAYHPSKLVQVLDPHLSLNIGDQTYEAGETAVAYVCSEGVCRRPVKDPEELTAVLEDALGS